MILHPNVERVPLKHPTLEGTLYVPKTRSMHNLETRSITFISESDKLPSVIDMYGVAMGTREHRYIISFRGVLKIF